MTLLLDMGNTRLKWAVSGVPGIWQAQGVADWQSGAFGVLAADWGGLARPDRVVAASVVDAERESRISALAATLFNRPVTWLRTPAYACGVRNSYAEPERLGVDRFLAMVAARADGHAPCVLASAGTALTLDAMTGDGRHLGGLIAPGPRLMQQALLGATAQVRPTRAGEIVEIADNTADAVASGSWQAAAALIERFYRQASARLGQDTGLILAGGDAALLQPMLSIHSRLRHDGVLRGLDVWARTPSTSSSSA